jgi:alpha-glucosidase
MCYDFDFLSNHPPTGAFIASVLDKANRTLADGWACWAFSNHDVVRHASRWNLDEAAKRVYAGLLLSIRGTVCLYQGEELGLNETYVAFEELQDPYGKRFWPKFKGRDGCRTPMPWTRDNACGGFTDGKPWLPVAMEHLNRAVGAQEDDAGSTLHHYRGMIAFRRAHPVLAKGTLEIVEAREDHLSFIRADGTTRLYCAFNLSGVPQVVAPPPGDWRQDMGAPFEARVTNEGIALPPFQAFFGLEAAT